MPESRIELWVARTSDANRSDGPQRELVTHIACLWVGCNPELFQNRSPRSKHPLDGKCRSRCYARDIRQRMWPTSREESRIAHRSFDQSLDSFVRNAADGVA